MQIALAGNVYIIFAPYLRVGSFWLGFTAFLASLVLLLADHLKTRLAGVVSATLVFATFLIAIVSATGDGQFYQRILYPIKACFNRDGMVWGSSAMQYDLGALQCAFEEVPTVYDLSCVNNKLNKCTYFQGTSNGGYFFGTYRRTVEAVLSFDIILVVFVFVLFVFAWRGLLTGGAVKDTNNAEPVAQDEKIEDGHQEQIVEVVETHNKSGELEMVVVVEEENTV